MSNPTPVQDFIRRWQASGAAERANFPQFAVELCDILNVPHPDPTTPYDDRNAYVFERSVPLPHGSAGRIDLYKRGCFVLEAKQGSDHSDTPDAFSEAALRRYQRRKKGTAVRGTAAWDTAMERAKQQAQAYARNLPPAEIREGRPPFLMVVDVGSTIALYAEFTRTGGSYTPFPDPHTYRLALADLQDDNVRRLLRQVWTDPVSLDPARRSARVTRDIAGRLAQLARSLERAYPPDAVANFLMRCLFTMFAEDVALLPNRSFTQLLADIQRDPTSFQPMLEHLWQTMNTGGFSVILRTPVPEFNGGLFAEPAALPLSADQIQLLIEAAQADWRDVEPAIFGTLLERALDPVERHKLGAHYTPRAYVERLVQPTVIEPLRAEWEAAQTAALLLADEDKTQQAIAEVEKFQQRLAAVKILDPACGSGNFLYVTLEQLKRLEGEVLNTLKELGRDQMLLELESVMVTPRQFLGIEVNPRAAAIAELVLWIGFLQWHFRTRGQVQPPTPIIRNYHNIECRDAVLAWDAVEPLLDAAGQPVTRWDGRTTKPHPVTGEEVPDETARVPAFIYTNPRPADWPAADFVVGNPPFLGKGEKMRLALGDGYVEALHKNYKEVPASADYVLHWWFKAAKLASENKIEQFGLIATNSISQTFNRRVIEEQVNNQKSPVSIIFAIPDHPWVDASDGAAVRISMTVGKAGKEKGILKTILSEPQEEYDQSSTEFRTKHGFIHPNLKIGVDLTSIIPLKANSMISSFGMLIRGSGFIVTVEDARKLGMGKNEDINQVIHSYCNGRDLTQNSRNALVIDLDGLTVDEVRSKYPEIYQWIYERVKPERDASRDTGFRKKWWLFGRTRPALREALRDLDRYIATPETAKHGFFVFLDTAVVPDHKVIAIALNDAYWLGILSSRVHLIWALATGGRMGVGNDPVYNKTRCFDPFPFPDADDAQKARIRQVAEELDAHRKRQQAQHPKLTMTDMYNVLEKVRAGEAEPQPFSLSAKEKEIYEQGLVGILKQLHDELDEAVLAAYGWPAGLSDEDILDKLVALNAERAAEEAQGVVRWLRPDYQAPEAVVVTQAPLLEAEAKPALSAVEGAEAKVKSLEKQPWPKSMAEQAQAVRAALVALDGPVTAKQVAAAFQGARSARVTELLETLASLGQARLVEGERFVAQ